MRGCNHTSLSARAAGADYSVKGVPTDTSQPWPRESAVGVSDNSGRLWLHGGKAYRADATTIRANDLWYYSVALNQWCWVSGSNAEVKRDSAQYSAKYVLAASNIMAGRRFHAGAIDVRTERILFYGGEVTTATGTNRLGDVWMFDIASSQWALILGSPFLTTPTYPSAQGNPTDAMHVSSPSAWMTPNGALFFGFGYTTTLVTGVCNSLYMLSTPAAVVTVSLRVPEGATVEAPLAASTRAGKNVVALGWSDAGQMNLNFSVRAEDGSTASAMHTIRIQQQAPRCNASWSATLSSSFGSILWSAYSSSASASGSILLPAEYASHSVFLHISLADGATIEPDELSPVITLGPEEQ